MENDELLKSVTEKAQTWLGEAYDAETDMYYGISIYYGFNLSGEGLDILAVGNEARIVGTVQYYETGNTYQVSGLEYSVMNPDSPSNIKKISEGHKPGYATITPEQLLSETVSVTVGEEVKSYRYAELAIYTSVSMEGLQVVDVYTTNNEESSSKGAMSLTCKVGDKLFVVRTTVLYDADGKLITESYFRGKTISVRGLIDFFNGEYQIKLFSVNDVTVQ